MEKKPTCLISTTSIVLIWICFSEGGVNFEALVMISDNNLEISGAGSDGLGLAGFSPVVTPASRPSAGKSKT